MIRQSLPADFHAIYTIINNAAVAYKSVIPDDRWHDPYMTRTELQEEMDSGVKFSCYYEDNEVLGVMGLQDKNDVLLIRHAYVLTTSTTAIPAILSKTKMVCGSSEGWADVRRQARASGEYPGARPP